MKKFKDIIKMPFNRKIDIDKIKSKLKNETDEKKLILTAAKCAGVAIGVILCISIVNAKQVKKYSITSNKAEEYFYKADYKDAINEYKKIAKSSTPSPIYDLKIAEIYSIEGNISGSRKYIGNAKKFESRDPYILNYIVFNEFMNKDYEIAQSDGKAALKIAPKNKKLIKTMFAVYMANNRRYDAKNLIYTYPYDKNSAYDISEYSRMLMIIGSNDEGFKMLREAWYLNKDEYKIYDVLSQMAEYDRDNLLEYVTNLNNKAKNDPAYKMWLAKIYSLAPETSDEAQKMINELNGIDTGKIEMNLIQAQVYLNTKKNDDADKLLQLVINHNKNDYRVLHTAGWYYLNKKDVSQAEKYCAESIVKNKNYPDNYGFLMPEIMKNQKLSLECEPYFRTALFLEPYNCNIMISTANYYWYTAKNTQKAMEYFKFAEIIKPDDPEIKYSMSLIDINNKNYTEAENLLKNCISLSNSTPKYHRTLGTLYMTTGSYSSGIKEIRYAYNADEDDILTLNNAGCYYITQEASGSEASFTRGMYNLQKAYEGINSSTDKYTSDTIKSNYEKAKKLYDEYENDSSTTLNIPDFVLFY